MVLSFFCFKKMLNELVHLVNFDNQLYGFFKNEISEWYSDTMTNFNNNQGKSLDSSSKMERN